MGEATAEACEGDAAPGNWTLFALNEREELVAVALSLEEAGEPVERGARGTSRQERGVEEASGIVSYEGDAGILNELKLEGGVSSRRASHLVTQHTSRSKEILSPVALGGAKGRVLMLSQDARGEG